MSLMPDSHQDGGAMSDINMTPLIDVMLVLLIIFIVTLPVINHAVKVELPKATSSPAQTQPHDIDLSITPSGAISWNKDVVDDTALKARIAAAASAADPMAVNIFADEHVEYGKVAAVLSALQKGGLSKINFITEPATPSP